jgi:hypothetical protein
MLSQTFVRPQNMFDTKHVWYKTCLIQNMSDTKHVRYKTCPIQNMSDTKHVRYKTCPIQNMSDTKHVQYKTCLIQNHFSCQLPLQSAAMFSTMLQKATVIIPANKFQSGNALFVTLLVMPEDSWCRLPESREVCTLAENLGVCCYNFVFRLISCSN